MQENVVRIPKWPRKFLYWYCKPSLLESIEGDLEEEFQDVYETKGKLRAQLHYAVEVLRFFRPFAIRPFNFHNINPCSILFNYTKVAFRSFSRDKINTSISALGLFLAILSAMIIYRAVSYESSYDAFHEKADRIFRVTMEIRSEEPGNRLVPNVGPPLGPAIKEFYSEVEDAVRLRYTPTTILATEDGKKRFYEEKIFFADPSLFNIFTYPLQQGDPKTALQEVNNIILTTEMAEKYFGEENPIGKILLFENDQPLVVSGVLAPIPSNTHFPFDFLRPFEAFKVPFGYPVTLDDWRWGSFHTYVLLKPGVHSSALEAKLPEFAATHFEPERASRMSYLLQPLLDIYFHEPRHDAVAAGNYAYVVIIGSVGVLLLLLAAFNFTNIFTAKSLGRARETGVRKTMGSSRKGLWVRYLMEPILVSVGATLLALLLLPYLFQYLNQQLGYTLEWTASDWWEIAPLAVGTAVILGIAAGAYPAFVMSSYRPLTVLGGVFKQSRSGILLRKSLVTLQFAITSFLLIGSLIISGQIQYLQNKDLGFDEDRLMVLRMPGEVLSENYETLKNALLNHARIENASVGGGRMDGDTGNVPILPEGQTEPINMAINGVKDDFFRTVGIPMITGREFDELHPTDSASGIILNEMAARTFGWTPEEALNKQLTVGDIMQGQVVGVVDNFHFTSLHQAVQPIVMYQPRTLIQNMYLRITPGEVPELIETITDTWYDLLPDVPIDYVFLDSHLQQLYQTDVQFARMVKIFSGLTILVAILGLYGLIALVSEQRIKEVSIRKVLGASIGSLIVTLSRSFLLLILLANLIAWPLIYWVADEWISNFAYRTDINWLYFGVALGITAGIAAITLAYQTRRVALSDPAKTLRQE